MAGATALIEGSFGNFTGAGSLPPLIRDTDAPGKTGHGRATDAPPALSPVEAQQRGGLVGDLSVLVRVGRRLSGGC